MAKTSTPIRTAPGAKLAMWLAILILASALFGPRLIKTLEPYLKPHPTRTTQIGQAGLPGPTTVTRINNQVIELSWNGTPREGYNLSAVLPMRRGDRVELFWLRVGCLRPIPQEQCVGPGGMFDVDSENRGLFRYNQAAYAIHIIHGNTKREIWDRGSDRMLVVVADLPLILYFNTIVEPGVYTTSVGFSRVRVSIDGYTPPTGHLVFRIVNRR
jgi:hypothetical protein